MHCKNIILAARTIWNPSQFRHHKRRDYITLAIWLTSLSESSPLVDLFCVYMRRGVKTDASVTSLSIFATSLYADPNADSLYRQTQLPNSRKGWDQSRTAFIIRSDEVLWPSRGVTKTGRRLKIISTCSPNSMGKVHTRENLYLSIWQTNTQPPLWSYIPSQCS